MKLNYLNCSVSPEDAAFKVLLPGCSPGGSCTNHGQIWMDAHFFLALTTLRSKTPHVFCHGDHFPTRFPSRIIENVLPGAHSCIQMIRKKLVKGASEHQNLGCAPKPTISHTHPWGCWLLWACPSNCWASFLKSKPISTTLAMTRRHLGFDPHSGSTEASGHFVLCANGKPHPLMAKASSAFFKPSNLRCDYKTAGLSLWRVSSLRLLVCLSCDWVLGSVTEIVNQIMRAVTPSRNIGGDPMR